MVGRTWPIARILTIGDTDRSQADFDAHKFALGGVPAQAGSLGVSPGSVDPSK